MKRMAHALWLPLLLFCFSSFLEAQINFGCPSKCEGKCHDSENTGRFIENATRCGCCHVKMIALEKGKRCETEVQTTIPIAECGPGLQCNKNNTCDSVGTSCQKDLAKFLEEIEHQALVIKQLNPTTKKGPLRGPEPQCDEYGDYQPVQCKAGLCFCVDKDGNRIFGEAPYKEKGDMTRMTCQCSRDYDNFIKSGLLNSDPANFLRCDRSGDYSDLQCTTTDCFCTDKEGELRGETVPRDNGIKVLPCFKDGQQYKEFMTPCLEKLNGLKAQLQDQSKNGCTIIGFDLPECSPDGTYAAKQCQGKECYCVNRFNRRYEGTGVPRYSQASESMTCNCVREKELLKGLANDDLTIWVHLVFGTYKCNANGNYLPIQCHDSFCYCIDNLGYQSGVKKSFGDRKTLTDCYKEEYEKYLTPDPLIPK